MKTERWQQVDKLFHAALECESEERPSFLAKACDGDDTLLREVESMLVHHEEAKSFMESPAYAVEAQDIVDNAAETLKGRTIGSYQVRSELGRGGMGQVYLAFDKELKRKIALKFLHAELTGDRRRLRRFQQEARAASALNHPNILTVFEIGEMDDRQFIATEFVEGRTLREVINLGQMHVGQTLDIAVQIGSALSAAHAVGVVHRDIKPENIMLRPDGYIKIVDFGLAKLTEEQSGHSSESTLVKTEEGVAAGTSSYMSPEQIRGGDVDARTDIWSFCVVLYEMIEGRHPFQGETSGDMLANILRSEPPLLAQGSPELRKLIVKGLFKDRTLRYQTMNQLLIDLRKIESEMESRGGLRVVKGKNKKPLQLIGFAAVLLLLVVVGAKLLWRTSLTGSDSGAQSAVPTVTAERTLTYALTVQRMRNGNPLEQPFQSLGEESFQNGWKFRLTLSSPESGFLYLLAEPFDSPTRAEDGPDTKRYDGRMSELSILYPEPSLGSDLTQPNQSIQTDWFVFDQNPGAERLWLIWSAKAVPELEQVRHLLNSKDRGLISEASNTRAIREFLAAHSSPKPQLRQDVEKRQEIAKVNGEVLASSLNLIHH